MRIRDKFLANERGAVAFEMPIVFLFLMIVLFLPFADLAIAGFQFLSAWQALRNFGQYLQYNPPPDVTNWNATGTGAWKPSLNMTAAGYPISNLTVKCGDLNTACSSSNPGWPSYYYYETTVTLSPMVSRTWLCTSTSSPSNPCSFKLPYSERFQ
jgi:hypothetical protein